MSPDSLLNFTETQSESQPHFEISATESAILRDEFTLQAKSWNVNKVCSFKRCFYFHRFWLLDISLALVSDGRTKRERAQCRRGNIMLFDNRAFSKNLLSAPLSKQNTRKIPLRTSWEKLGHRILKDFNPNSLSDFNNKVEEIFLL